MVYTDDGIEELQKIGIRNEAAEVPTHICFAGSDNTYTGAEIDLTDEYIRKEITWSKSGKASIYTAELTSAEAVGSYIGTIGIVSGSDLGTGSLFAIDQSFISDKTASYNVSITGEIIIERPS